MDMITEASIALLDGTLSKNNLERFLSEIPEDAELKLKLNEVIPDRPGDQTRFNSARLVARWQKKIS